MLVVYLYSRLYHTPSLENSHLCKAILCRIKPTRLVYIVESNGSIHLYLPPIAHRFWNWNFLTKNSNFLAMLIILGVVPGDLVNIVHFICDLCVRKKYYNVTYLGYIDIVDRYGGWNGRKYSIFGLHLRCGKFKENGIIYFRFPESAWVCWLFQTLISYCRSNGLIYSIPTMVFPLLIFRIL